VLAMVRVLQAWPVARSSRQGTTTSASLACRGGGMQNAEATVGLGRFTVGAARFDGGCSDRSCTKQSDSTEPLSVEALCVWTCCIENTCTLNRRSSFLLFSKCSLRLLRSVLPRSLRFIAALCIATNLNITGLRDCVLLLFPVRHSENAPKCDVTPNTPAASQSRGPTASSGAMPRAVTG
jgi:hypothetical protein